MKRKIVGLAALFVAALMLFAGFDTADARRGGSSFHGGGHRSFSARSFSAGPRFYSGARVYSGARIYPGHRHAYRGYARRGFYYGGIPLVTYGAYSGGCYWLREKALYTGSRYWWQRYWACRNGYYGY